MSLPRFGGRDLGLGLASRFQQCVPSCLALLAISPVISVTQPRNMASDFSGKIVPVKLDSKNCAYTACLSRDTTSDGEKGVPQCVTSMPGLSRPIQGYSVEKYGVVYCGCLQNTTKSSLSSRLVQHQTKSVLRTLSFSGSIYTEYTLAKISDPEICLE